jgi:hypothetical protein
LVLGFPVFSLRLRQVDGAFSFVASHLIASFGRRLRGQGAFGVHCTGRCPLGLSIYFLVLLLLLVLVLVFALADC